MGATYLRTGDTGFLHRGELFVTGRLSGLIILDGRNLHPQDIEQTAIDSHGDLRSGGVAAIAVEASEGARLVVLAEVAKPGRRRAKTASEVSGTDLPAVAEAIRSAVAEAHGARVHSVALLRPGSLPKTSSGKLRRGVCRQAWLAGALTPLEVSP